MKLKFLLNLNNCHNTLRQFTAFSIDFRTKQAGTIPNPSQPFVHAWLLY